MKQFLLCTTIGLWLCVSFFSIDHFFSLKTFFPLPISVLGWLGWSVFFLTLVTFSQKYLFSSLLVFFFFFSFGFISGPFLEPPADSLDHLQTTQDICGKHTGKLRRKNDGLWQYSMNSVVLCVDSSEQVGAQSFLRKIDLLNGLYYGLLATSLFVLAQSAGLPGRWSFFSVVCCVLFFGTNKFSYFSYYSLGPTFTSIAVYWLWTAYFFFKKRMVDIVWGVLAGVVAFPVLWVNHYQEASFLAFTVFLFLLLNTGRLIWGADHDETKSNKITFVILLFLLCFVLPQLQLMQDAIALLLPGDYWTGTSERVVLNWNGLHLVGKFWAAYRVNDTLGLTGYTPLVIAVILLFSGALWKSQKNCLRIVLLGVLPFIFFCVPLLHLLWGNSVRPGVYYRLCYSSMFWLSIAFFLFVFEKYMVNILNRWLVGRYVFLKENLYFILCLVVVIFLAGYRSFPVYGKLDFILTDSRSWWREWRPVIDSIVCKKGKPVYSDYLTTSILYDVFGQRGNKWVLTQARKMHYGPMQIEKMDKASEQGKYRCIINIHPFTPTWVPGETHHWSPRLADPAIFYRYNGKSGADMISELRENPPENCEVFF